MAKKKFLSFAAAFVAAAQALTLVTATGVAEQAIPDANTGYISADISEDLPDNDELLRMYLDKMFYGGGVSLYKDYGKTHLTGTALELYNALRSELEKVAAGERTSTKITVTLSSTENLGDDLDAANKHLLVDMPEALYWYQKTSGGGVKASYTSKQATISFAVADEYALSGAEYEVDPSKITAAKEAVANAQEFIIKGKELLTDYEKIVYFRDKICDLTSYNDDAADNKNTPYGNPWQLVWVFDGDDSTKVVCEGYSKAFQYLCDETGVECYTVTGYMNGGGHMWNIVVMDDGKSYLVDITNCDGDEGSPTVSIGYPDKLLLKGATQSSAEGCSFSNLNGLSYTYDKDIIYDAKLLTVSTTDYEPPAECDHVWGTDWVGGSNGHWHVCTKCEQKSVVVKHTEVLDEDSAVAETCTTDGKKADTVCSDCGFKVKEGEVIKAHHTEKTIQENIVDATCEVAGSYDSVVVCEVCNKEISRESITGKKLPHTPGDPVRKNEVEATCTKEGSYTEVISCTVCNTVISSTDKTIEKLPHTIDKTAWESDDNKHWHVCSVCGETTEPVEHTFDVETTPATCTEDGKTVSTCVDCGKEMTEVLTKTGHKWDDGKVTKKPTCVDKGIKTFTCVNCKETKTEDVETVDHTWNDGEVTTPATCTAEGVKTITCTVCNTTKTEAIKATGHTYDDGKVTTEATCAEEGEKTYTCTKCGDTKTEAVAKIPHTFNKDKWMIDGDNHKNTCVVCDTEITEPHKFGSGVTTIEPTCTNRGEMTYTCVCGKSKTSTVDALGHEPGEAVRENEVAATVDKEGSYDSVIRCTLCDEIIESNTVVIPKLTPAEETPNIKGEDGKSGWEVIDSEIKSAKDKDVITVDMNKATVVPKSIFEEVRGKDVTVSFELDNDFVWSVNGKTVSNGTLADIDFSVKTGSNFIPSSVTGTITDEKPFTQLSLAHDGAFGFTAVLSVDCGKSNANLFASLYYYNGGKLDKIDTAKIGTDGIVKLSFKHASDYLITVYEEKTANEPANNQTPSEPNNSDTNPSDNPNTGIKTDSVIWIAALSCLVLTAPVFKRSKKSGK